jgi:hypothetical protein
MNRGTCELRPEAIDHGVLLQPGCNHGEPSLVGWGGGGVSPWTSHTRNRATAQGRSCAVVRVRDQGGIALHPSAD